MKAPPPVPLWARLSIIARLGVSTGLALIVAGAVMLYSSVKTDSTWHQEQLATLAESELAALTPALAELAVIGDFSTMTQMLEALAGHDNIDNLHFVDRKGNTLRAASTPPPPLLLRTGLRAFQVSTKRGQAPILPWAARTMGNCPSR